MMFKFLWHHIKPYKWLYLVMIIGPIIGSFYTFTYSYAVKLFVDAMATGAPLFTPLCLFIAVQVAADIFWRISDLAERKAEPRVRRSIILESFDYVTHHSFKFFQDHYTGTITSKLKGLLNGYDKFWAEMHHGLSTRILRVVINISALIFINVHLGMFFILWACVYFLVVYCLGINLQKRSFLESESTNKIGGLISDSISNITSLFAFAARKKELKALNDHMTYDFIPKQVATYSSYFRINVISGLLYWVMFFTLIVFTIHLKKNGIITIGDFVFILNLVLIISDDLWKTSYSLRDFAKAMGDFKSSLSILNIEHTSIDIKGAKDLVISNPRIVFQDVWFGYDSDFIFKDLCLDIKAGEKIGLVGESGAGKSTLVNLLLRYFELKRGEILIDGIDIAQVTQDSLRAHIAVIPQDTLLFHRSILENVRYGRFDATDEEIMQACQKAHIHDFIVQLPEGYQTEVGERGIKLSGGQRQRIAIARAMLKDAPILILDEATSALDSHTEKRIQESLNVLIADTKKTVIAIAHRLSTLKHMDRIIVLENGQIIEQGSHQTLVKKLGGLYQKLWQQQTL